MNRIPLPGAFDFLRRFRLARKPASPDGFGNRLSRGWGSGSDALGVRPWDESATRMAAIASARLGYPVAIETPRETRAELFLLIDGRSCLQFGSASQTVRERIVTLGLALAFVALHDGWRVHPVVFADEGFLTLPPCFRPEDWLRLHLRLSQWPVEASTVSGLGAGLGYPPRQLALSGFCLCSDADPDAAIMRVAGSRVGRLRVYDPWEKSPPHRLKIPLWGPRHVGREDWFHRAGREAAHLSWQRRDRLWESEQGSPRFSQLSHAADEAWETGLDPWLQTGGAPWQ